MMVAFCARRAWSRSKAAGPKVSAPRLHSFWYARALTQFLEVQKADPDCGIARVYSPNLIPCASGSAVDQLTVLVCRRL